MSMLSTLLKTPARVVIVIGVIITVTELLIMLVVENLYISLQKGTILEGLSFDYVDPVLLSVIVAPVLYFLVFRSLKQQIELKKQIAERSGRLTSIAENLADGLITIDTQGIVLSFNPAAGRIFGYQSDEVIGRNVSMLMPAPYHGRHDGFIRHYLESGEKKAIGFTRELEGRHKDGSVFSMDLAVSEIRTDETRQFIGTIRDISERKAAEDIIMEKTRELELRGSYDSSYAKVMALFSSSYDQQQVLSGLLDILANNHPFPVSAIYIHDEWSGDLELAASHGAPASLQKTFERGTGLVGQAAMENATRILHDFSDEHGLSIEAGVLSFRPAAVLISPISFQQKVTGVLVLASSKQLSGLDGDFIERLTRQLGVAMNNLKQHADLMALSEQLKKRGEQIEQQNAQLEQSSRMKSEFLANMSHELRTPLNAIIGFSEVLKDGVMGELNAEQLEYIGDVFTSGQHLLSLINDILDLSKIEAGKMELDVTPSNVTELLSASLSIVREKAVSHQIKLEMEVGEHIGDCLLDERRLKQIVYNLLSNAVKFTPDGGRVRLSAERVKGRELAYRRPAPLNLPRAVDADFLEIRVTDSGIGIHAEAQHKLFNAFTQLDSSLARKYEGTGLGLVMVKRIAELHGGAVGVESEPGRGSTFVVWLAYRPVSDAAPVAPVSIPDTDTTTLAAVHRVLIVEDDDNAAELIRRQLEAEGYATLRATSAEEALTILAQDKPDLITLDIKLPGMDGWDFLTQIKKQGDLTHLPVVIVSIVADEKRGFSLGASQVLQKPVLKEDLLAAVAEVGRKHGWTHRTLRILVADDDPKAVEFVSRHLEGENCTVYRAYGGAEAIEVAGQKNPDLIILDLMMPEVNGFDVVQALKSKPESASIPIIILTAKIVTADDRKTLNGDVIKIVEKSSFDHGGFISEIRRILKPGADTGARIPMAANSTAPPPPAKQVAPLILIAEDNDGEANLIERHLRDQGYRTSRARNGRDALEQMIRLKPDLVTLDLMMPEMDGFEFLNEKAMRREFAAIPVLIVSGMDNPEKGLSLGAHAILRKPLQREQLLEIIASMGLHPVANRKPKLLIVDDDPKSVRIIASYFDPQHYDVIQTFGGREGLAAAQQYLPDLLLLDLMMPEMDGFQVVDRLKQDARTRAIPVIVLTAKLLSRSEREELMQHVRMVEQKGGINRERFLLEVSRLLSR